MRYFLPILALLILVGALAGVKFQQISSLMKAGEAFAKMGPPPESVSTDVARELGWEGALSAVGSIAAARGVAISNESPGVVKRIAFESGDLAKVGQVLVELDTGVEKAQLANAEARRELAEQTLQRSRGLSTRNIVTASQLEKDEAEHKAALADVAALQAQIARKIVRAPFAGRLGIREINLGQYLSPGTTLTTLEALDTVYVDFALPQQALSSATPGLPVRVAVSGEGGEQIFSEGRVSAVDPSIDAATRSIRLRATIPNAEQKLRPGMFANVAVVLPKRAPIVAIPVTAVLHAPYGDSVFVVESAQDKAADANVKQARQQFVKLGEERGDFVAVLDGVSAGQEVVVQGAFKLRNGAKITVNNELKPDAQVAPQAANR